MEKVTNRISRRRMLKRIGAGAAVAWSAPILSSLRTPAFAQYEAPECIGQTCASFTPCSSANPDCVCVDCRTTGRCVPGSTSCASLEACSSTDPCPAGSCCAFNTCCTPSGADAGVCIPPELTRNCPPGRPSRARRVSSGAGTIGG
jgi:hypothetical protein